MKVTMALVIRIIITMPDKGDYDHKNRNNNNDNNNDDDDDDDCFD